MKNCVKSIGISSLIMFMAYSLYLAAVSCVWRFIMSCWKPRSDSSSNSSDNFSILNKSYANESHAYIKVQGVKFHYIEVGDKSKPLLLFLHGFLDFWIGWRFQIAALKDHFRIVAVDLKGCGDSEKPQRRRDYDVDVLARELHDVVIALGETECILIGHDIGAILGWYLASLYPEVVTKFIAISAPHPNIFWEQIYTTKDIAFNARFVHLCQIPDIAKTELLQDNMKLIDDFHSHTSKDSDIMKAYKFVFSRRKDLTGPVNYLRNLSLSRLHPGHISVPTMLIVGSKDPFVNVEAIVKSTEYIKDSQIKLVEGAGRAPQQESHKIVNDHLISFLCDPSGEDCGDKVERGRIGNLMSNTFNTIVDNVKKKTGAAWRPQMLMSYS